MKSIADLRNFRFSPNILDKSTVIAESFKIDHYINGKIIGWAASAAPDCLEDFRLAASHLYNAALRPHHHSLPSIRFVIPECIHWKHGSQEVVA